MMLKNQCNYVKSTTEENNCRVISHYVIRKTIAETKNSNDKSIRTQKNKKVCFIFRKTMHINMQTRGIFFNFSTRISPWVTLKINLYDFHGAHDINKIK
jgi:hypothetical protein